MICATRSSKVLLTRANRLTRSAAARSQSSSVGTSAQPDVALARAGPKNDARARRRSRPRGSCAANASDVDRPRRVPRPRGRTSRRRRRAQPAALERGQEHRRAWRGTRSRVRSTWSSSPQAATDARWTNSCGATPTFGRYAFSAAMSSGSPATKPERYPVIDERFESVLKTTTFAPVGDLSADAGGVAELELAVRLVGGEHEAVLRASAAAARRTRAARSRRSGCSGSSSRGARRGATSPPVDRVEVGEEAALLAQRQRYDLLAGEQRAALGDRVAGLGDERRGRGRRGRRATCARRKIASFEPSVGTTSAPGRASTPNRRSTQPAIAARSSGQPGRHRIAASSARSPSASASRMNARRLLARIALPEVDQLDPARRAPRASPRRAARTGRCRVPPGQGRGASAAPGSAGARGRRRRGSSIRHLLVAAVRVAGRAGAEVDRVEAALRRTRRPASTPASAGARSRRRPAAAGRAGHPRPRAPPAEFERISSSPPRRSARAAGPRRRRASGSGA